MAIRIDEAQVTAPPNQPPGGMQGPHIQGPHIQGFHITSRTNSFTGSDNTRKPNPYSSQRRKFTLSTQVISPDHRSKPHPKNRETESRRKRVRKAGKTPKNSCFARKNCFSEEQLLLRRKITSPKKNYFSEEKIFLRRIITSLKKNYFTEEQLLPPPKAVAHCAVSLMCRIRRRSNNLSLKDN